MSRMFCTVKEAAETLNASEDQINALLERGILHEFRQGPHRLLREADVGALDGIREGASTRDASRLETQGRPPVPTPAAAPVRTERPSSQRSDKPKARRPARRQVQRSATAIARPPRARRTKNARRGTGNPGPRTKNRTAAREEGKKARAEQERRALAPGDLLSFPSSYGVAVPRSPAVGRPPAGPLPAETLGQWFWMGLVQDRPAALALLSGLVLLALSALVAGVCLAADGF